MIEMSTTVTAPDRSSARLDAPAARASSSSTGTPDSKSKTIVRVGRELVAAMKMATDLYRQDLEQAQVVAEYAQRDLEEERKSTAFWLDQAEKGAQIGLKCLEGWGEQDESEGQSQQRDNSAQRGPIEKQIGLVCLEQAEQRAQLEWRLPSLVQQLTTLLQPELRSSNDPADPVRTSSDSHQDFYQEIIEMLKKLDSEWLAKYGDLLNTYMSDFFDRLRLIIANTKGLVTGTDEDGNLIIDRSLATSIFNQLEDLRREFSDKALVSFDDENDAKKFMEGLGLDGFEIKYANGKYNIALSVDSSFYALEDVYFKLLNDSDGKVDPAQWNALISAKDSIFEKFSHINNALAEKYQRQMQLWDTLVKILSSSIDSISQADRTFLSNLL